MDRRDALRLGAALGLGLTASAADGQVVRTNIYSNPAVPSDETLGKLNLRLAWRRVVPLDGKRDGLLRVDVIGPDVFVLTRSGLIARIDAETGEQVWRTRVGKPYTALPFMTANSRGVLVAANADLYGLDRATGSIKFEYNLPAGVSAAPAADEERVYLPTSTTRLYAFRLPDVIGAEPVDSISENLQRAALYGGSGRESEDANRPRLLWSELTGIDVAFQPAQGATQVFVVSSNGRAAGFDKEPRLGEPSTQLYRLSTEGKINVPPRAFGDTVYVGSDDAALYAVNIITGKVRWRHTAGTEVTRPPFAVDKDVFVTSRVEGLARIDRESGEAMWRVPAGRILSFTNPKADRILAVNDKFVYATDRSGRLLVLDRKRGTTLSMLDITDFRLPVTNDQTDRLYLAANNGMIVCLHDKEQREPIRHRKAAEDAINPVFATLKAPVTDPGGRTVKLIDQLNAIRRDYRLTVLLSEPAFRVAGLPDPRDREIKVPRTNKEPLEKFLKDILVQVGATFEVVGTSVRIVPAKK